MNTILILVRGKQFGNFESANVTTQLDALSGTFNFRAVTSPQDPLPFSMGDSCAIEINGVRVLTGYIENIYVDYDASSHTVAVSGRSKTADIIDSMIGALEITAPVSLKEVIEKVVANIQAPVKVVDNVGDLELFNEAEDYISPSVGENAFQFIEKLARKRQVLLTPNGYGNIVITRSGKTRAPGGLQKVINGDRNNIETGSVSYNSRERFNRYLLKSQLNIAALNFSGDADAEDIVDQDSGEVIDEGVRASRQLVLQAESASSDEQTLVRAQWEANIRKARSIVYSATVSLFGVGGTLWSVNQLARVKDDFAGIDADKLINNVTFSQDTGGSYTTLALVDRNAYTLKLNEPDEGNEDGIGF